MIDTSRFPPIVMPPAEALQALLDGNARFVRRRTSADLDAANLAILAEAQHPFAMVLGCADSRVPPVHVFDQPPGAIFTCRVAGGIVEPGGIGSFEYAVTQIGSPSILVVLAHEHCGAITAAVETRRAGAPAPGSMQTIVDAVAPAIAAVEAAHPGPPAYAAIERENALRAAAALSARSAILAAAVAAGRLAIAAMYCSFATGAVELL